MQAAALHHHARRTRLAVVLTLAGALVAGALGCGGSSNNSTVVLPPGGFPIGELQCQIVSLIPGDTVVQGEVLHLSFRLTDENQRLVGAFLPVSFEVQGGFIPNPPDVTDADGRVSILFVTDVDHLGHAFVRLIQPDYDLRCDVTFRLVRPACVLDAQVLDEAMAPVAGFTGCGSAAVEMTRDEERIIVFRVRRPNPLTGTLEPVVGGTLLVRTQGQAPLSLEFGPTDAEGRFVVRVAEGGDIEPHPSQVGTLVVGADLVDPDENGDGLADGLPCESCAVSLAISDPPCDQDGAMVDVDYFEADGDPRAMDVLRPGEHAVLSLQLTRDGVPIEGEDLLVQAGNGSLDGSALPITVTTDVDGRAMVTYRPHPGFGGTMADPAIDTVSFEAMSSAIECSLSGEVAVVTCGLELTFAAPPTRGVPVDVQVTVTQVDPDTTDGRNVVLSATGGSLSPPAQTSGPLAGTSRMITYTPGATASMGSISLSFLDAYPCDTTTESFGIAP